MRRINTNNPRILLVSLAKIPCYGFGVRGVVVDADEGRRDVGLLVEVREAEAREGRGVVYDCGLVFRAEAGGEGVAGLRGAAVDAVDEGWDGGGGGCG